MTGSYRQDGICCVDITSEHVQYMYRNAKLMIPPREKYSQVSTHIFCFNVSCRYWKSAMSPDPPITVLLFTFIKRDKERNLANDPYEPREKTDFEELRKTSKSYVIIFATQSPLY